MINLCGYEHENIRWNKNMHYKITNMYKYTKPGKNLKYVKYNKLVSF